MEIIYSMTPQRVFYKVGYTDIAGDNIFYLEKDKFIKNDEKSKGIK